jgi:hypothetical protein
MIIFIIKDKIMTFRTKLDYSDNRQIKQRERTNTILSGATVFGVPFSALTTGPSTVDSGTTESFSLVVSTFSGNSATTIFNWYDSRMELGISQISALTSSNSGVTQNVNVFTSNNTTIIDGNSINLSYSGVSFDLIVTNMMVIGPSYSGSVEHTSVNILSANTLDYTGRTIWVDNTEITRTKKIIVTESPQVGYVLKCVDSEGKAEWGPVSGATSFSGNTSATCITDLYISNLYGCSPITIHSNVQNSGSTSIGLLSTAFGVRTSATTNGSYSEGIFTISSGNASHAEGLSTTATTTGSHAEGQFTISSGNGGSHSEGNNTTASGDYSHAEGGGTVASGTGSHAEGQDTTASGTNTHAEGDRTIASLDSAHAEGKLTIASGAASHAEGRSTKSIGDDSHSQGNGTIASGAYSHAGGNSVVASGQTSFVHFNASGATYGAYGDQSAILGGINNNINSGANSSVVLGGVGNLVNTNTERSVVLGGQSITATTNDTVYVPDLVIDGLINITQLETNGEGLIVDGASDITLKENVNSIDDALDKILNLNPVSFEWVKDVKFREGTVFGLIAQEVEKVIPEIVRKRAKGNGTLTIEYKELIPWIIGAIKELSSNSIDLTQNKESILETQTIASEDNNIELNYNGTKESALDGGIIVVNGISENADAEFIINSNGDWVTNNNIIPKGIIIPEYTPTSTNDSFGRVGLMTRDDFYLYIKRNDGWGRVKLEIF